MGFKYHILYCFSGQEIWYKFSFIILQVKNSKFITGVQTFLFLHFWDIYYMETI